MLAELVNDVACTTSYSSNRHGYFSRGLQGRDADADTLPVIKEGIFVCTVRKNCNVEVLKEAETRGEAFMWSRT